MSTGGTSQSVDRLDVSRRLYPNKSLALRLAPFPSVPRHTSNWPVELRYCDTLRRRAIRRNVLTWTVNPKVRDRDPGDPPAQRP